MLRDDHNVTGIKMSRAIVMVRALYRGLLVFLVFATPFAAGAQDVAQRGREIVEVIQGRAAYTDVFDDSFTSQMSKEQFSATFDKVRAQYGPVIGLDSVKPTSPAGGNMAIRFERGIAWGAFNIAHNAPYRVVGFIVNDTGPTNDSTEKLLADIRALPGQASILITPLDGGKPLLSYNADRHLGIGSAFKLYILSALAHQVEAGKRKWSDVVRIATKDQTSGASRDWVNGAPVTLHTLATLMISVSDNTATDNLLSAVGRSAVESEVAASGHSNPALLVPFMSTREMIALKTGGDVGAYRAADVPGRRTMLTATANTKIDMFDFMKTFTGPPTALDVEWLVSGEDMVKLMRRIRDLKDPTARQIMAVSPSVADHLRDDLQYIGFKGGSEPGVVNLSWLLQDKAGKWDVVTLTLNNPDAPIDPRSLRPLAMRAIALAQSE